MSSDERLLPKATVKRAVEDILPSNVRCAPDTIELIQRCCTEFVHLVTSEASAISERERGITSRIRGHEVCKALTALGFDEFQEAAEAIIHEHKEELKDKQRIKSARTQLSASDKEEMARMQAELFAQAKKRHEIPHELNESGPSAPF